MTAELNRPVRFRAMNNRRRRLSRWWAVALVMATTIENAGSSPTFAVATQGFTIPIDSTPWVSADATTVLYWSNGDYVRRDVASGAESTFPLSGYYTEGFVGNTSDVIFTQGYQLERVQAIWSADGPIEEFELDLTPGEYRASRIFGSADGQRLAYLVSTLNDGSNDGNSVHVYDAVTGLTDVLPDVGERVITGFAASGRTLTLGSPSAGVGGGLVLDVETMQTHPFQYAARNYAVETTPNSRYLRVGLSNIDDPPPGSSIVVRNALYDVEAERLIELPVEFASRAWRIADAADKIVLFDHVDTSRHVFDAVALNLGTGQSVRLGLRDTALSPDGAYVSGISSAGQGTVERIRWPVLAGSITRVSTGLPAVASSVLVNIVMTEALAPGFITADKCSVLGSGVQTKSNGNYAPFPPAISNLSVVPVDSDGSFCIYNLTQVHLVADIQGSFAPPATASQQFFPSPPDRRLDTRKTRTSALNAGSVTRVTTGVAAGASAVLVNIVMTEALAPGFITADKCSVLGSGVQTKSNGNYASVPPALSNLSVVPVDSDGSFCIYNLSPVHLVADVQGSFGPPSVGGQQFFPIAPNRKLDTRVGGAVAPDPGSVTRVDSGAPAGASAVLVNIVMTEASSPGFITADKCSILQTGPPTQSNGNYSGTPPSVSNLSVVPVDLDGSFCIYNLTSVHLVADIQGSFAPVSTGGQHFFPIQPVRVLDTREL